MRIVQPPFLPDHEGRQPIVRGWRALVPVAFASLALISRPASALEVESASGGPSRREVILRFSAAVDLPTATRTSAYGGEGDLAVLNAHTTPDGRTVILETTLQDEGREYRLSLNGLREALPGTSELPLGTSARWVAWRWAEGYLRREIWHGVMPPVSNLVAHASYPHQPDETSWLHQMEFESPIPPETRTTYSERITGWLRPERSGSYRFYLSAGLNAELHLSPDDQPERRVLIAQEPRNSSFREYVMSHANLGPYPDGPPVRGDPPLNVSKPVLLLQGRRYYLELIRSVHGFYDHFALAWQAPGDPEPAANVDLESIPSRYFGHYLDASAVELQILRQPEAVRLIAPSQARFEVEAKGITPGNGPLLYQWQRDGTDLAGATDPRLVLPRVSLGDHGARFQCRVRLAGVERLSEIATLEVTPPEGPPSLRITSPAPGTQVGEIVTLACDTGGLADFDSIAFELDGAPLFEGAEPIPGMTTRPFSLNWRSANAPNGWHTIQALVRDHHGRVLQASDPVRFQVRNQTADLERLSPDPSQTLSGIISWRLRGAYSLQVGETGFAHFVIDGREIDFRFVDVNREFGIDFDTTQLPNGTHEFVCQIGTEREWSHEIKAQARFTATIDNGRQPLELRANFSEVHLVPGESVDLLAFLVHTDGDVEPVDFSLTSSRPDVVRPESENAVAGAAPGKARLTLSAAGRTVEVRATVRQTRDFPHLSRSGRLRTDYQPGDSLFLRTMFFLGGDEFSRQRGLGAATLAAGINAIEANVYYNPVDMSGDVDWERWKWAMDHRLWANTDAARRLNLGIYLIGDDLCRFPGELHDTAFNPESAQRLRYVFDWARDTGRAIAIDMVDEVNLLWGDTPFPTDGRWSSLVPPIADDAFARFAGLLRALPWTPPRTWSVMGASSAETLANWQLSPGFAEYHGLYWTENFRRATDLHGRSVWQTIQGGMAASLDRWWETLDPDRPAVILAGLNGPYYQRLGDATNFTAGIDRLIGQPGFTPRAVAAQVAYAMLSGMAGVRAYAFDWHQWRIDRQAIGQTGAHPQGPGAERWNAMATAYRLAGQLEPYLLQPATQAIDLGATVPTGARRGPRGNLLVALNTSELAVPIAPDLRPYHVGLPIHRYRLAGSRLDHGILPETDRDTLTLEGGEAVIYLFTADQQIAFDPLPDQVFGDPPHVLRATADSGLPVSLTLVSGPATLVDGRVIPTGAGEVVVRAEQPGDRTYHAAFPIERRFQVFPRAQTLEFNPPGLAWIAGPPVPLLARSSAGLPVRFSILHGSATIMGDTLAVTGPEVVVVRAEQAGDHAHSPAPPVERWFLPRENLPPVITSVGDRSVEEDSTLNLVLVASDPDQPNAEALRLEASELPEGATFDSASSQFTWTPSEAQGPGRYPVTIVATDRGTPPRRTTETFTITVNEVNTAPWFVEDAPDLILAEGTPLILAAHANDSDLPPQSISYQIVHGAPSGASVDPRSGELRWTPTETEGPGQYTITLQATDSGLPALAATRTLTVSVTESNEAPALIVRPQVTLLNPSFEADHFAVWPGYVRENGPITGWTSPAGAGINPGPFGDPFNAGRAPDGTRAAFIQENGTLRQTVSGLIPGADYQLRFHEKVRHSTAPVFLEVTLGAQTLVPTHEVVNAASYRQVISEPFRPAGSDLELAFHKRDSTGRDSTLLLDAIQWTPMEGQREFHVAEGSEIRLFASASDPDWPAQRLVFHLEPPALEGARLDPDSGEFVWKPSPSQDGEYAVKFVVQDDGLPPRSAHSSVILTVPSPPPPRLTSVDRVGGQLRFRWSARPGARYRVQAATTLVPADWGDVRELTAAGESAEYSESFEDAAHRYFRVVRNR